MSKYHVGDAVRVRGDLMDGELYGNQIFIGDDMMECRGRLAMITKIDEDGAGYRIDICPQYFWTDEMFEDDVNIAKSKDDVKAQTVDIGYYLEYCGHRVIKNVYYGGYTYDKEHVFCTTINGGNQYTLPVDAIEFVIPHEVD